MDSFLSSVVERPHDPTTDVDIPDSALEYGQCTMRGVLLKRERMSKWNKTFCIIRNNFLECHKLHGNAQHVPPGMHSFPLKTEGGATVVFRRI